MVSDRKRTHLSSVPTVSTEGAHACALDRVPDSTPAEVVGVTSDHGANRRLAQLGIHVGARLQVRQRAPLGGPILLEVAGSTVALGRALARRVIVRILP